MRDHWRQLPLEDAADVTIGRQRSPKNAEGPSMVPYLRAANVKDGRLALDDVLEMNFDRQEQATYALQPGDVLVTEGCGSLAELGASARWGAEIDGPVCFQNTLLRIRARSEVSSAEFLDQWARWAHRSGIWASVASGTNIFHIGAQRARSIPIVLPPLDAQRRICDLASSIENACSATEWVLRRAEEARCSLAEELIESGGWARERLADVVDNIDGGRSPVTDGRPPAPGERGVLKLSAVKPRQFNSQQTKAIGPDVEMPAAALVKLGDVLITRSNTPATVGAVCLVEDVLPDTFLSDLTLRLHAGPRLEPSFLAEALNTLESRRQIVASASGTSGSMRKVSRRTIRELTIPVPPLEEQVRISGLLGASGTAIRALGAQLAAVDDLRIAVIDDLLRGNREIPNSYDELLEHAS